MAIKLILKKDVEFGDSEVKELILDEQFISVGNSFGANVFLDDDNIVDEQFVIINEENKLILVNRAEGTFFNDDPIEKELRVEIKNGDEVQVGNFTISFLNLHYKTKKSFFIPASAPSGKLKFIENGQDVDDEILSESHLKTNGITTNGTAVGQKSFADILNSLRKDEDRFYFQLVSGNQQERLNIENEELQVGWDLTGRILSADPNIVVMPRATIKKDWGGVMLNPISKDSVWVNNDSIEAPRRLKNGDKLTFLSAFSSAPQKNIFLEFCEPAALVEINSILPHELPSVAPNRTDLEESVSIQNETEQKQVTPKNKSQKSQTKKSAKRNYFGYFSFGEVFLMFLGTLISAVLVYLILEYW